jgi:peptidoglycan/LPS O-acetylase OafA/YrhL
VSVAHGGRLPALDYVKALAIAAVTVTHGSPFFDDPRFTDLDRFTTALTAFQIPAFLFVSGFLSDTGTASGLALLRRRLFRIVPPYVVATLVAWACGAWTFATLRRFVFVMVTGGAVGIYYYVPVLVLCTLLVPLWSRLGTRTLIAITLVLFVYAEAAWLRPGWRLTDNFYWAMRDPFGRFYLGHFLLGIVAARAMAESRACARGRRGWCAAARSRSWCRSYGSRPDRRGGRCSRSSSRRTCSGSSAWWRRSSPAPVPLPPRSGGSATRR